MQRMDLADDTKNFLGGHFGVDLTELEDPKSLFKDLMSDKETQNILRSLDPNGSTEMDAIMKQLNTIDQTQTPKPQAEKAIKAEPQPVPTQMPFKPQVPKHEVGEIVTLKDGTKHKIIAIHPDGQIEVEDTPIEDTVPPIPSPTVIPSR